MDKIIKELASNNSRLAKEFILNREANAKNDILFKGFQYAYDPMITFGVKKIPESRGNKKDLSFSEFQSALQKLMTRELSGHAALDAINDLMSKSNDEQWNYWYAPILRKDMRCGITATTINNVVKKGYSHYMIPIFSVQLAEDGADHPEKIKGEKIIEVKLDGVRVATIVYPNGHVIMLSRNGKEFTNFEAIENNFKSIAHKLTEPMVFDGEIMSKSFNDLMKQLNRKYDVDASDSVLWLFDMIPLTEFEKGFSVRTQLERKKQLTEWFHENSQISNNIDLVGFEIVNLDTESGKTRFSEINKSAIDMGYEGIMIKDISAIYKNKRNFAWLKKKPVISVTLKVTAIEEGTGKNQGLLGAFVCEGVDSGKNIIVNVGSGLTDKQRSEFFDKKFIGEMVEIEADAISQNQDGGYSLRFPRFVRFRTMNGEIV